MKKQWGMWATVCAGALILAACGGGGDSPEDAKVDVPNAGGSVTGAASIAKPFLGSWKHYPDNYCTDNWPVVPATEGNNNGSVMPSESVFTETQYSYTYKIFSDNKCTQLVGTVTVTNNLSWEAVAIDGWPGAARVQVSYSGLSTTGNVVVNESEAKAESAAPDDKTILGIKADKLYFGNLKTAGTDGYATIFRAEPGFYR